MSPHGGAAQVIADATKASGVIVDVAPVDFLALLKRVDRPLVVVARGGVFAKHYRYLTSYKGLAFTTKSTEALALPSQTEVVGAKKMWMPSL